MSASSASMSATRQKEHLLRVEIVSHCYAAELPQYAAMLAYQASSLVLHKPKKCKVCLSVCVWEDQEEETFDLHARKALAWAMLHIPCKIIRMKRNEIGRRCIGRNHAALHTSADYVWFADVDQVFRDGILDQLISMPWPENASMIYPREIKIHQDWVTGDKRTASVDLDDLQLIDTDPTEFVPKRYRTAIGGVQIVRGDFARKHGYLNTIPKWHRTTEELFKNFYDDVVYRRYCAELGLVVGVDLPGLYRLRHTKTTYQEDKR